MALALPSGKSHVLLMESLTLYLFMLRSLPESAMPELPLMLCLRNLHLMLLHPPASSQEQPSICAKFLLAGESMLRPSRLSADSAVDPDTIPPILGVLIKSVLSYDKKWKHYAMFNSTEYDRGDCSQR